jgi:ubiquinone/menaquinone biosynthesis C-methylase UbiE
MNSRAAAATISRDTWTLGLCGAFVLLGVLAVVDSGAQIQHSFGKPVEDALQAVSVLVALTGVLLRFLAAGNGGWVRQPRIFRLESAQAGAALIFFGLALATQVWWFPIVAALGYLVYLGRRGQDADPHVQEGSFSWRMAAAREYNTLFFVVAYTVLMEITVDLRTGYATLDSWPADWPSYFLVFIVASALYVPLRLMQPQASSAVAGGGCLDLAEAEATTGLRVDGRARLVDTLENLISGGQQEAILAATLHAAEVGPGDRLLDVGCGTGKLAIAAARLTSPMGMVFGVDATPAMIDLANERGRAGGSPAQFQVGVAERLRFEDGTFQAVTCSYFFHHLPSPVKPVALREMWRVLAPGGRLVITDYGRPRTLWGYIASIPMRFDFHEYVRSQLKGELDDMLAREGLGEVRIRATFLGYIGVLRITKDVRSVPAPDGHVPRARI